MSLVNEQSCPALAGHPLYRDGWPTLCPELHHGTAVLLGLCPPGPRARGARAPLRGSLRPQSALWTAVALPPLATHHPRPRQGPHTSLGPDPPVPPPPHSSSRAKGLALHQLGPVAPYLGGGLPVPRPQLGCLSLGSTRGLLGEAPSPAPSVTPAGRSVCRTHLGMAEGIQYFLSLVPRAAQGFTLQERVATAPTGFRSRVPEEPGDRSAAVGCGPAARVTRGCVCSIPGDQRRLNSRADGAVRGPPRRPGGPDPVAPLAYAGSGRGAEGPSLCAPA